MERSRKDGMSLLIWTSSIQAEITKKIVHAFVYSYDTSFIMAGFWHTWRDLAINFCPEDVLKGYQIFDKFLNIKK